MTSPIRVALQGVFKDSPDQEIIDGIVESIRQQQGVLQFPGGGMVIKIPDFHVIFKTFQGRDLCVIVMGYNKETIINIIELRTVADIPKILDESDIPPDMMERMKNGRP